jgi:hypothetical protein
MIEHSLAMRESEGKTIQVLVLPDPTPMGVPQPVRPHMVTFSYCPFCGTRILDNKEVLEWIERKMNSMSR